MALTDNIVAYWKLDESSGNASDSVGSNTLTNSNATYAAAKINNGAVINGGSPGLSISDTADLSITSDHSFSFWFKPSAQATNQIHSVIAKYAASKSYLYRLYNPSGGQSVIVNLSSDGSSNTQKIIDMNTLSVGTFYHIVFVYTASAGTVDVYQDNVAMTTATDLPTSVFNGTADFKISGDNGTVAGTMDEVGVWKKALSSSEVSSLYNSGSGLQYPFGETPSEAFIPKIMMF